MRIICRLVGHQPARSYATRDSYSFAQESWCKRCHIPLERSEGSPWILQQRTKGPRADAAARASLPPLRPKVADEGSSRSTGGGSQPYRVQESTAGRNEFSPGHGPRSDAATREGTVLVVRVSLDQVPFEASQIAVSIEGTDDRRRAVQEVRPVSNDFRSEPVIVPLFGDTERPSLQPRRSS